MPDRPRHDDRGIGRRDWLRTAVAGGLGLRLAAGAEAPADPSSARERAAIEAQARKAGLAGFRSSETERYLGIGDAPDAYRAQALKICRALATAFDAHFREKGFAVAFPDRRLTVIALKDADSYRAFLGHDPGAEVGGHYDLDTNRLVIFDFRPDAGGLAAASERVNTFTLVHEAAHQLTFNTGLLDLRGDVPVCLSEGLAMYCELWRPVGRAPFGPVNRPRLDVFARPEETAEGWIALETLLADDASLQEAATVQLAYAESWALVHFLMKTPSRLPRFRAYLDAIRPRRDPSHRLDDARKHLGDLALLDRDLKGYALRLMH